MKKLFFIFVLVSCFAAGFAQEKNYTWDDLRHYFMNMPGAELPPAGEVVKIEAGRLAVDDIKIDGNGMDYLVKEAGLALSRNYSNLIYIYSENIHTRKMPSDGYWPTIIIIQNDIEVVYTGLTAPAISEDGERIDVPVFLTK